LSYNGTANQYDANGNTIQKSVNGQIQNYVYNADNRLIEVQDASSNTIAKYTYDPFGRRIKKTVSPAGGGSGVDTYYLYSDEGLIGEYDSAGTEIKTYGYKPNSTWSTDPIFCHSRENGNPGYYFYHNDHLGTPQKMTNLSGAIVWSATYDAFGKATIDAGSTITNNLRFPGQYFDAETGWHNNYHRYYDPNTGRYVTEDPIGLGGGDENFYNYVSNNPYTYFDPFGLRKCLEKLKELKLALPTDENLLAVLYTVNGEATGEGAIGKRQYEPSSGLKRTGVEITRDILLEEKTMLVATIYNRASKNKSSLENAAKSGYQGYDPTIGKNFIRKALNADECKDICKRLIDIIKAINTIEANNPYKDLISNRAVIQYNEGKGYQRSNTAHPYEYRRGDTDFFNDAW
jgi:RHS repeat-associated protein